MEQVKPLAHLALKHNVPYFRSNIFKPRTHPNSFQGLGNRGLPIIEFLLDQGLKLVSEPCSLDHLESVKQFANIIQVGARNMQNFEFLKNIGRRLDFGKINYQVMLKRGFSCNIHEWLSSAEYLEKSGVPRENIILCERGSRNFAAPHGVTLDFGLAYKVKLETDYKVIIDPSHGTKSADLVLPMANGAMAMGFDGVMIETHPQPEQSKSDAAQAIHPADLDEFLLGQRNLINWNNRDRFSTSTYN